MMATKHSFKMHVHVMLSEEGPRACDDSVMQWREGLRGEGSSPHYAQSSGSVLCLSQNAHEFH